MFNSTNLFNILLFQHMKKINNDIFCITVLLSFIFKRHIKQVLHLLVSICDIILVSQLFLVGLLILQKFKKKSCYDNKQD